MKLYILLSLVYKYSFIAISTPFKNTKKKKKQKQVRPVLDSDPVLDRSIHGSRSGSCKTRTVDPGSDRDPAFQNGYGSGSTWTQSRSDPLPSVGARYTSMSLPDCFGPEIRSESIMYLRFIHSQGGKL